MPMPTKWKESPIQLLELSEERLILYNEHMAESELEFRQLYMGQWAGPSDDEIAAEMEHTIELALERESMNAFVNEVNARIAAAVQIPRRYLEPP